MHRQELPYKHVQYEGLQNKIYSVFTFKNMETKMHVSEAVHKHLPAFT